MARQSGRGGRPKREPKKRKAVGRAGKPLASPRERLQLSVAKELDAIRKATGFETAHGEPGPLSQADQAVLARIDGILRGTVTETLTGADLNNAIRISKKLKIRR